MRNDPNSVYAWFYGGLVLFGEKKYDSSILYFGKASSLKSVNGMVMEYTDAFYEISEQAKPDFDIKYSRIVYNMAVARFYAKDFTNAESAFTYCISNQTYPRECYFYRGCIYLSNKEKEKACVDFHAANTLGHPETKTYIAKYCSGDST